MAFIRPGPPFMVLRIGQILSIKSGDMLIYILKYTGILHKPQAMPIIRIMKNILCKTLVS